VSAISYCASHFTYFVSHSISRAPILYCVSHFCVVSSISCFASHFHVVSVILLFCQIFYIYGQSFFGDIFCILQVYYLDNLLNNVPIPAGPPHCQFFTSDVIDKISILNREVSRDVTFGKLPVSKTCFCVSIQPLLSLYC
jgi:hypothetical protein